MHQLSDKTLIIIDKYHSGQASAEEISYLDSWKNASSSNHKAYNEFINLLELINSLRGWSQFDNKRAWSKFQDRIGSRILKLGWIKYGAVAILLFVFATTIWNFNNNLGLPTPSYLSGIQNQFSILSDGSEFFLQSDCKIFTQNFSKEARTIRTEGSYFVNVEHDKKHPFKVNTDRLSIEVLGTSFKVEEDELATTVKVRDGKVLITSSDGSKYELRRNETLTLSDGHVSLSRVKANEWGLYSHDYEDESILSVIEDLNDQFGKLQINVEAINPECRITTKIEQSTIIEILNEIGLIFQVDYTIKNGSIVVNNISC